MASLSFSFCHSSFSKLSSDSHLMQLRCQVTWTNMKNFISPFSLSLSQSFPHFFYFFILFPETVSPVWVKIPMYLLPMANKSFESSWPKTTQEHICTSIHLKLCKTTYGNDRWFLSPFLTPFHHFLTLSQNRERKRERKSSIIFSSVPLSRLPN